MEAVFELARDVLADKSRSYVTAAKELAHFVLGTLNDDAPLLMRAIEAYGREAQTDQLVEELAELIVAVHHFRRGRIPLEKVLEEIADVDIMLGQFALMHGAGMAKTAPIRAAKLARLEERLG